MLPYRGDTWAEVNTSKKIFDFSASGHHVWSSVFILRTLYDIVALFIIQYYVIFFFWLFAWKSADFRVNIFIFLVPRSVILTSSTVWFFIYQIFAAIVLWLCYVGKKFGFLIFTSISMFPYTAETYIIHVLPYVYAIINILNDLYTYLYLYLIYFCLFLNIHHKHIKLVDYYYSYSGDFNTFICHSVNVIDDYNGDDDNNWKTFFSLAKVNISIFTVHRYLCDNGANDLWNNYDDNHVFNRHIWFFLMSFLPPLMNGVVYELYVWCTNRILFAYTIKIVIFKSSCARNHLFLCVVFENLFSIHLHIFIFPDNSDMAQRKELHRTYVCVISRESDDILVHIQ